VSLASRGLRDMDGGTEKIEDADELRRVRAQARKVIVQSVAVAAVLTAAILAVP
jgi:hypothetical protein